MAARELEPSLKLVAGKLCSRARTTTNACEEVRKLVLRNIMAYQCNYFSSAFLNTWQQFPSAALHATQDSGEANTRQIAALNGRSMATHVKHRLIYNGFTTSDTLT